MTPFTLPKVDAVHIVPISVSFFFIANIVGKNQFYCWKIFSEQLPFISDSEMECPMYNHCQPILVPNFGHLWHSFDTLWLNPYENSVWFFYTPLLFVLCKVVLELLSVVTKHLDVNPCIKTVRSLDTTLLCVLCIVISHSRPKLHSDLCMFALIKLEKRVKGL